MIIARILSSGRFDPCNNPNVLESTEEKTPRAFAIFLVIIGIIGWVAAFALTVEKFALLANPAEELSCDFSVLVQCRANLDSWQGAVFGFPNPLIGVAAWVAPIVVGMGLLARARFARWFWVVFNLGVVGALAFVIWLVGQSIFALLTLCPWCMVTWSAVIPLFWIVTARNLRDGVFSEKARPVGRFLISWMPLLIFFSFFTIAVLAQVNLDVLNRL